MFSTQASHQPVGIPSIVVVGESAVPVGSVPCLEVKIVHAVQVASDLIVCHVNAHPGAAGPPG
jgi:hypothetical protein